MSPYTSKQPRALRRRPGRVIVSAVALGICGCQLSKPVYVDDHRELRPYVITPTLRHSPTSQQAALEDVDSIAPMKDRSDAQQ